MFISTTPKCATLHHESDDAAFLIIDCTAADNSGVLEIGKEHVFASRRNRSIFSRRHACKLNVEIRRRSSVSEDMAAAMGLSKEKIGALNFYPPSKAYETFPETIGFLLASVFLDDSLFDSLMKTLHSGKRPKWLQLEIAMEGAIGYGCEPDGSRMEWKIGNPSDTATIDVTSIAMGTELFT